MADLSAINLNRLVAFVAVVEVGSLTGAAARLGLAKTMVSKHMQLLEAELGVTLLMRTTRRLSLTEAGRAFYEASRDALRATEEAVEIARTGLKKKIVNDGRNDVNLDTGNIIKPHQCLSLLLVHRQKSVD